MSDEMDDLRKLIWRDTDPESEDLYNALAKALVVTDGKTALRHRFIVDESYDPLRNRWYNQTAADKEVVADRLLAKKLCPTIRRKASLEDLVRAALSSKAP